jgi:hypothetical protein
MFDGSFGNHFDDSTGCCRIFLPSSQRLSYFIETLARFRIDLSLLAELEGIAGEMSMFLSDMFRHVRRTSARNVYGRREATPTSTLQALLKRADEWSWLKTGLRLNLFTGERNFNSSKKGQQSKTPCARVS